MNPSGLWRGRCDNRVGHFKFITVELLPSRPSRDRRRTKASESENDEKSVREILDCVGRPDSVEELLKQIGLEVKTLKIRILRWVHTCVFSCSVSRRD
jgi:hypothetical protein